MSNDGDEYRATSKDVMILNQNHKLPEQLILTHRVYIVYPLVNASPAIHLQFSSTSRLHNNAYRKPTLSQSYDELTYSHHIFTMLKAANEIVQG